jgi:hypothetical protein
LVFDRVALRFGHGNAVFLSALMMKRFAHAGLCLGKIDWWSLAKLWSSVHVGCLLLT